MIYNLPNTIFDSRIDEHTVLLLHGDSFIDSSIYGQSITTSSGVSISSDQKHFSQYDSYYFNNTSGNRIATTNLISGTNPFTIDMWIYPTDITTNASIFWSHGGSNDSAGGVIGVTSTYGILYYATGAKIDGPNLSTNTWYHIAFVGTNTTMYLFVNGTLVGTTSRINLDASVEWFGTNHSSYPERYRGYMQEIRVSDVARWTTDFTPPTEPYV